MRGAISWRVWKRTISKAVRRREGLMIYITGDTHHDFKRFDKEIFPEQKEMTKDDYVIILGDFGGVWDSNYHKNIILMG